MAEKMKKNNPDYEKHLILIYEACMEKAQHHKTVADQLYTVTKRVYDETLEEFYGRMKPEEICNIVLKTLTEEKIPI